MNVKRAPLWGSAKNILIIILLLSTLSISAYFKHEQKKLNEINSSLNTTINGQTQVIGSLKAQISTLTETNKQLQKEAASQNNINLGTFKISAYCNCKKCCGKWAGGKTASGTIPTAGRTIAVDPNVIPLGSQVVIDGHTYVAEDTGSAIKGTRIDIYFDSHEAALNWGIKHREVSIVN